MEVDALPKTKLSPSDRFGDMKGLLNSAHEITGSINQLMNLKALNHSHLHFFGVEL
jgi:hypothetical protein